MLLPLKLEQCYKKTNKEELEIREAEKNINNNNDTTLLKQNSSIRFVEDNHDEISINPEENLDSVKDKWSSFINKLDGDVRKNLNDDPHGFSSAVERFMNNYNKNVKNPSTLMTGLIMSFRNYGTPSSNVPSTSITKKGKKIPVQPTSVSRRKVLITGRRKIQAGKKVKRLSTRKTKAPHSLNICVKNNVGLGENKFVK